MDQWEGTIISVPASKIQESLGLTNSLHDRDIWQLFLRVSKEFYETLPPDTSNTSWTVLKPEIKQRIRAQLGEYCRAKGVFRDQQDVEPALEWRLYQLQRNRRAELKKSSKPDQSAQAATTSAKGATSAPDRTGSPSSSTPKPGSAYYDPVRDTR